MRCLVIVIFTGALLASCLPMVARRYVPSPGAGELMYSHCLGQTHIPRGIRFTRNRSKIETALVQHRDTLYLEVLITPSESNTVQLHEHSAQVYVDESTRPREVDFDRISLVDPIFLEVPNTRTMDIDKPMIGERLRLGNFEYDKNFWLARKLEVSQAELIRVMLPGLVIDGELANFPEIRFKNELMPAIAFFTAC